jgi:hypothetical protein
VKHRTAMVFLSLMTFAVPALAAVQFLGTWSITTLASRLCKECSASSRDTCPERSGDGMILARMGYGAAVPCPASAHRDPGARTALRLKRGLSQLPGGQTA